MPQLFKSETGVELMTVTLVTKKRATRLGVWFFLLASCWTILITALAWWDYWRSCAAAVAIARYTAGESIDKDLLYRRWTGIHSEVSVPITATTPPSPYAAQAIRVPKTAGNVGTAY